MFSNLELDEFVIDHPVFFEFYDVWNCGTTEEINEQFNSVWSSYANELWGNEATKERMREWVLTQFGLGNQHAKLMLYRYRMAQTSAARQDLYELNSDLASKHIYAECELCLVVIGFIRSYCTQQFLQQGKSHIGIDFHFMLMTTESIYRLKKTVVRQSFSINKAYMRFASSKFLQPESCATSYPLFPQIYVMPP